MRRRGFGRADVANGITSEGISGVGLGVDAKRHVTLVS